MRYGFELFVVLGVLAVAGSIALIVTEHRRKRKNSVARAANLPLMEASTFNSSQAMGGLPGMGCRILLKDEEDAGE